MYRKTFSKEDKKTYIAAVKCLQSKPSIADPSFAPGARTRYDDFVAVHINQTLSIHGTVSTHQSIMVHVKRKRLTLDKGNFLTWHRWYLYSFEQALKNECRYKGDQPVRVNRSPKIPISKSS